MDKTTVKGNKLGIINSLQYGTAKIRRDIYLHVPWHHGIEKRGRSLASMCDNSAALPPVPLQPSGASKLGGI